jgi:ATP-dependent RNA helicase DeaD
MIIFARTKLGTEELAEKLTARGFAATAINGDVQQAQREKTIQQLRDGRIDVLVATDVAARGLDVERISHVLNYDIPYDTESYVHRVGRTGRAGRKGEAILFVTPRERGMLRSIERATRQPIEPMELPSIETVNEQRVGKFLDRITAALESPALSQFRELVERYEREQNVPAVEIAAALASLAQGDQPLLLAKPRDLPRPEHARPEHARPERARPAFDREPRAPAPRPGQAANRGETAFTDERAPRQPSQPRAGADVGMETFRIEVGHVHGVKPGNIVGAIANEAELESRYIGRIDIQQDHSYIDLPEGMPRELMEHLKKVRVAGQPLRISRPHEGDRPSSPPPRHGAHRPGDSRPPRRPHAGKPRPAGPRKPHRGQ